MSAKSTSGWAARLAAWTEPMKPAPTMANRCMVSFVPSGRPRGDPAGRGRSLRRDTSVTLGPNWSPTGGFDKVRETGQMRNAISIVASLAVLVIGVVLALFVDAAGDFRIFGWVLIVISLIGLATPWVIDRQRATRSSRD